SVVSNFDQRLPKILEALGILDLFYAVTIPATSRAQKPDRRIFEAALEDVGATREEALYVGDDPHFDLEAARAAGLLALDVTTLPSLAALPLHVDALGGVGGKQERLGG
ncbi:MAG: HAD-IA family hydrolase, partial [Myxococcota bacterium]